MTNTNTNKKGFTLIEMLVVVAVISILSGLTLTGIAGFTQRARDTKRVGDLRAIQVYIESYYAKCGIYPGSSTCVAGTPGSDWAAFQTTLNGAIQVNVPADPLPTSRNYFYGWATGNQSYILGVKLESFNRVLDDAGELEATTGYTGVPTNASYICTDASPNFGYCIGS